MGRRGLEIELRAVSHDQLLAGSIKLETAACAVCQSVGERVVRVRVNRRERADLRAVGSVFGNCGRGKRQDTDVDWGLVDIGQGDGEWSRGDLLLFALPFGGDGKREGVDPFEIEQAGVVASAPILTTRSNPVAVATISNRSLKLLASVYSNVSPAPPPVTLREPMTVPLEGFSMRVMCRENDGSGHAYSSLVNPSLLGARLVGLRSVEYLIQYFNKFVKSN